MHERKLNRLKNYNYSLIGKYFITFCVKGREQVLGNIHDGKMQLSDTGKIFERQWNWLFDQYNFIKMGEYIIMPDHFHGIIEIIDDCPVSVIVDNNNDNYNVDNVVSVGNGRDRSLRRRRYRQRFIFYYRKIKPIPELIGALKTTSSKQIHLSGNKTFQWQKSYHDRIIRNENELYRIENYIRNNPQKWDFRKERNFLMYGTVAIVHHGKENLNEIKTIS